MAWHSADSEPFGSAPPGWPHSVSAGLAGVAAGTVVVVDVVVVAADAAAVVVAVVVVFAEPEPKKKTSQFK